MAAKKKGSSSDKQLKANVKSLKAELKRSEATAARWKKEAKRSKAAATASQKQVTKLNKKLATAKRTAGQASTRQDAEVASLDEIGAPEAVSTVEPAPPDASWTVARLREEARSRGLTGLSGKTKAQLIDALT